MLVVQESGSERLLGGIGVLFLLLALALLALVQLDRLVDWGNDLLCLVGGIPSSLHDGSGDGGDIVERRDLALLAAKDRGAVLAVVGQEVGDAVLDVDKAGLQVVEGGNDLIVIVSTCFIVGVSRLLRAWAVAWWLSRRRHCDSLRLRGRLGQKRRELVWGRGHFPVA